MAQVTHRYCEQIGLTSASGVPAYYKFSCNGLYDPNVTATGHQPMYFDQFSGLYYHYVVLASRIKILCYTGPTVPYLVNLFIDDVGGAPAQTDPVGVFENSLAQRPKIATEYLPVELMASWDAKKYFGPDPLDNNSLAGTGLGNPVEQSYFTICVKTVDGITSATARVVVEIEYTAIWKELSDVAPS